MNVRFIDTSVMANMLKIPGRCNQLENEWYIRRYG